jgi:hypothetical protein
MLEQRRDFRRHKQMQFRLREFLTERAERRRHQHGVAEVFELEGENFFWTGAHEANWSS